MEIKEIKAYQCGNCYKLHYYEHLAKECCKPLVCDCGKPRRAGYTICDECIVENDKKRDQERYDRARKVNESEYKVAMLTDGSNFYHDSDEYYEELATNGVPESEYPTWAWGCEEVKFAVDIETSLETAAADMHDEFDDDYIVDREELLVLVSKWNAKQTATSYYVDHGTVVILGK